MSTLTGLNGATVRRREETIFILLPREAWRSCGKCDCTHCQGREGMWDTLAVSHNGPKSGNDHAWTVHNPGLTGSAALVKAALERTERLSSL